MIILMGLVGAGKGTQATFLAERYGYRVISTGELLRQYATEEQHARMLAGELLGDNEIIEMVDKVLDTAADIQKCLLDGFPRSVQQTSWLLDQAASGRFRISAFINIAVTEEVVRHRLLGRGRSDDNEATIAKRFEEYRNITSPIFSYLDGQGVTVYHVDGDQEPEAVHKAIVEVLHQQVKEL